MKSIKILATCALPLLLTLGAAQAKPEKGAGKKLDTNGDGVVSLAEAEASGAQRLIENFAELDRDGSGDITRDEFRTHREERRGAMKEKVKSADVDGNGAISLSEATNANLEKMVENFDKLDSNGDGEVSREEMQAQRKQRSGPKKS